jgi:DivIVA domain-containing protein
MPLTPAEVHNVAFKKPPIGKRGYDEEEVDAFLDIIEVELARLIEENNDLRSRAGGQPAGPAAAGGAANPALAAELSATKDDNNRLKTHIAELEKALTQDTGGAQAQVVALQQRLDQQEQALAEARGQLEQAGQAVAVARQAAAEAQQQAQAAQQHAAPAAALAPAEQHAQAIQVLALAQATADQHLAASKAEADRLLTEAQTKSVSHVGEAEARAKQLEAESTARAAATIRDAEERAEAVTGSLEQRKAALEAKVEELRSFEREYRGRLKSYLESQLRDQETAGRAEPGGPAGH